MFLLVLLVKLTMDLLIQHALPVLEEKCRLVVLLNVHLVPQDVSTATEPFA